MRRPVPATLLMLIGLASAVDAQVSVYSVLGIGFPSRPVGVGTRALGDGIAAIDPGSAVNPGALAIRPGLNVVGVSETTNRNYTADGVAVEGLRDTRFPFWLLAGQLGGAPVVMGLSYSTYTDRSYHVETSDTVTIRGEVVPYQDELSSDGGIADIRAAVAWDASLNLKVGVAVHLLSGSTRERMTREFDHTEYASVAQRGDVSYTGWGVSAGVVYAPVPRVRLGLAARKDGRLNVESPLLPALELQLPWTLSAGAMLMLTPALRWSVSGNVRTWTDGLGDVPEESTLRVFDTWEVGTGIELGGAGTSRVPLRLGIRYAKLPFSPEAGQPKELDFSAGSGVVFAGNRALFEFAVERAIRDGGGASERAWQLFFGLTLRP